MWFTLISHLLTPQCTSLITTALIAIYKQYNAILSQPGKYGLVSPVLTLICDINTTWALCIIRPSRMMNGSHCSPYWPISRETPRSRKLTFQLHASFTLSSAACVWTFVCRLLLFRRVRFARGVKNPSRRGCDSRLPTPLHHRVCADCEATSQFWFLNDVTWSSSSKSRESKQ